MMVCLTWAPYCFLLAQTQTIENAGLYSFYCCYASKMDIDAISDIWNNFKTNLDVTRISTLIILYWQNVVGKYSLIRLFMGGQATKCLLLYK